MMLKGKRGQKYLLENDPFSSGGEGDIHRIKGIDDKVIKVYHKDRITSELEQKIEYMVKRPPNSGVLNRVAWPVDMVYDESGQFRGFVMPKLDITNELNVVYAYPPKIGITYEQKLLIAQNICHVINEVHESGYIFGDFNPSNIGINLNTGFAYFLDADSYHIIINKKSNQAFRCVVCSDGYVAPELISKCDSYKRSHPQEKDELYKKVPLDTFTIETDNFALAIHMFKLMMNGFTPFNGINEMESASTASPGLGSTAVKRDNYCFKPGMKPQSPAVPPIATLPDEITELFSRAFIEGRKDPVRRPSAKEWYKAIETYSTQLQICHENKTHMYRRGLSNCPWCEANQRYQAALRPRLGEKQFLHPVDLNPTPLVSPPVAPSAPIAKPINAPQPQATPLSTNPKPATAPSVTQPSVPQAQIQPAQPLSKSIGPTLTKLAWIVFVLDVLFSLWPFVQSGSFVFDDNTLFSLDISQHMIFALCAVSFLSFSSHLKDGKGWNPVNWLCLFWSVCVCWICVAVSVWTTYWSFNEEALFSELAKEGFIFLAANIVPTIIGGIIHDWPSRNNAVAKSKKMPFKIDTYSLLLFIVPNLVCIPLFLDLELFYGLVIQYNLIPVAMFAYAVFVGVIGAESNYYWGETSLVTSGQCLVLCLGANNDGSVVILWLLLAIAYLAAIIHSMDYDVSLPRSLFLLFIVFIAGGYVALTVINDGVGAITPVSHWCAVAPALISMMIAAWNTVQDVLNL